MNIYMFNWKGKRVAMRSIHLLLPTNEKEPKFISICNRGEFLMESKETKQRFSLAIKEVTQTARIPDKMKPLLEEFKGVVHDELPEGLPPMKDIQHTLILSL